MSNICQKNVKNMLNICQKYVREHQKIHQIIYIYLYFYGLALVSSGRDLDARKGAPEDPNPKKRMLGLAPVIFFRVDAPKTQ